MDFSQDDLFDAIDKAVRDALQRGGIVEPPVDALSLAEQSFGLTIEYQEPEDEDEPRQYGAPPKKRWRPNTIILRPDQSEESQHALAARAVAKQLLPGIFTKLGIVTGTENRSAEKQLMGLVVTRLLLPTRWFATDARKLGYDLAQLKDRYPTVGFDMLAWRILDVDEEPCVIAVVDDGTVAARRSNRFPANKKLTAAEEACLAAVAETNEPARRRRDDWTAWGWPTNGIPFRRIILRAVPEEL
ncbi:hypothetical protein [Limnoglobus roseus]|uniref:Uncharacterized protein n=1 Tax=Limnoglobus roseus TaxID=2598579 RepID=A0A5C1ANZ5_9BACT|nr:hypothetical protein [Limnoglobus roseus]QEL19736.1 hypothetical protein PX52LOC_06815 [Limnoglobus roseus]